MDKNIMVIKHLNDEPYLKEKLCKPLYYEDGNLVIKSKEVKLNLWGKIKQKYICSKIHDNNIEINPLIDTNPETKEYILITGIYHGDERILGIFDYENYRRFIYENSKFFHRYKINIRTHYIIPNNFLYDFNFAVRYNIDKNFNFEFKIFQKINLLKHVKMYKDYSEEKYFNIETGEIMKNDEYQFLINSNRLYDAFNKIIESLNVYLNRLEFKNKNLEYKTKKYILENTYKKIKTHFEAIYGKKFFKDELYFEDKDSIINICFIRSNEYYSDDMIMSCFTISNNKHIKKSILQYHYIKNVGGLSNSGLYVSKVKLNKSNCEYYDIGSGRSDDYKIHTFKYPFGLKDNVFYDIKNCTNSDKYYMNWLNS